MSIYLYEGREEFGKFDELSINTIGMNFSFLFF